MATVVNIEGRYILASDINEEFEFTRAIGIDNIESYTKKVTDLTEAERNLIIGSLLPEQTKIKTNKLKPMLDLKQQLLDALKQAKKQKPYITIKEINKVVGEVFEAFYKTPEPPTQA